jgi:transposase
VIAYHILKEETTYRELGHDYFTRQNTVQLQQRLIRRLETLGLRVTVQPVAVAA